MERNWTPEPWFVANDGTMIGAKRNHGSFHCVAADISDLDAARAVACVNACRDIEDPSKGVVSRVEFDEAKTILLRCHTYIAGVMESHHTPACNLVEQIGELIARVNP